MEQAALAHEPPSRAGRWQRLENGRKQGKAASVASKIDF